MKAKTIKLVLRKVIKKVAKSITNDAVRTLFTQNAIVTGGSIASMLLGEPVNDFDIYFRTREATVAIAEYYVSQFEKSGKCKYTMVVEDHLDDRVRIKIASVGVVSETDDAENEYQYFEAVDPESGAAAEFVEKVAEAVQDADAKPTKEKPKYRPVFFTANAITLSGNVQLITRFYGEPDDIHANYDFEHCKNYGNDILASSRS